ncbi:hypothetical protein TH63_08200 [Rufibacter radiotolerans]|uniref:Uncharacterized protein n=2 Tax=Rufibacter radiotolerans TaxID=1379910 RepID=A0A0H4VP13_9BACT|nr:hypothetical protein TH63_08200 [Rufibacter radiotolerans]
MIVFFGTSCEGLEDALEKDFNISNTVPVTITGASAQQVNATIKEVDFNNGDLKEHKDKIKDLTLDGITLKVTQFTASSGNTVKPILNGQLEFAQSGSTSFKKIGNITNLDLATQFSTPSSTDITVPLEEANKNELMNLIKGGNIVQFRMTGSTNTTFTSATVDFKIISTLTAGL